MKINFALCTLLLCITPVYGQNIRALQINDTDGNSYVTRVDQIDSIYFSDDGGSMYVVENGTTESYSTDRIAQMNYTTVNPSAVPSITWNGTAVTIVNPLADAGVSITAEGADVTIHSTYGDEVEYELYGSSNNGSLKVYSSLKLQLTLMGLTLTNPSGPAINIQTGKKTSVKVQGGTLNTLTDGSSYTASTEDQKGCLFSEGQLIFKGAGTLNVNGNYKHAICSDDYIEIRNGVLNLKTTGNGAKGLKANDSIIVAGGTTTITQSGSYLIQTGDTSYCAGVKADLLIRLNDGSLTVSTSATGGKGISCDGDLYIGTSATAPIVNITTTGSPAFSSSSGGGWGGSWWKPERMMMPPLYGPGGPGGPGGGPQEDSYEGSPKGMKIDGAVVMDNGYVTVSTSGAGGEGWESKTTMTFNGGYVYAYSAQDDAINAKTKLVVNGGYVMGVSAGNDAIDCNGSTTGAITVSKGALIGLSSAGSPEEGIDIDNYRYISVTGGYMFGAGGQQSAVSSLTGCTQPYGIAASGSISSGKYYGVTDASGNILFGFKAPISLSSQLTIVSAPSLNGKVIYSTSAPSNTTSEWGNIFIGGLFSSSSNAVSFTVK